MALKKAFLTFDDGPQKGSDDVLEALHDTSVKAAFFVTGKNVDSAGGKDEQKRMLLAMRSAGHLLGNHCLSHAIQTKNDYQTAYGDLTNAAKKTAFRKNYEDNETYFNALIIPAVSIDFKHARLPGDGRTIKVLVDETVGLGMKHHGWDFEFAPNNTFAWVPHNDWQGIAGVGSSHIGLPSDGSMILLHDRHWKGKKTLLVNLINKLKETHELKVLE